MKKKVSKADARAFSTITEQLGNFTQDTLSVLKAEIDDAIRLKEDEDRLLNKLPAEDRKGLLEKWDEINHALSACDVFDLELPVKAYVYGSVLVHDKGAIINPEVDVFNYEVRDVNKLPGVIEAMRPANERLAECKILVNKAARKLKVKNVDVWRALEIDGDW